MAETAEKGPNQSGGSTATSVISAKKKPRYDYLGLWFFMLAVYIVVSCCFIFFDSQYWPPRNAEDARKLLEIVAIKGSIGVAIGVLISAFLGLSDEKMCQIGAKMFHFAPASLALVLALIALWGYGM